MSEPSEQPSEESIDPAANETDSPDSERTGPGKRDVLRYLQWAGLGLCILLILVAGLRVYSGVGAFISLWIASKYEPLVSAGFNLAVLLAAAYGVAILSRRLTASS